MKSMPLAIFILIFALTGCNQSEPTAKAGASTIQPVAASPFTGLIVETVDGQAVGPAAAKANAESGSKIVLTGYIGGRAEPFVKERAMFTLIDAKMPPCEDACKTPWDACCEVPEDIIAGSATVQVVDADGKLIKSSLNVPGLLAPGQFITVAGTVRTNDSTGFVINAEKVAPARK